MSDPGDAGAPGAASQGPGQDSVDPIPPGVLAPSFRHEPRHPMERFFDSLRGSRRGSELPASTGARRRRAVVTMVRDEALFLPIWLSYYSRFFAPEDIHVLDHGSTDGSTDRDGFVRIPVAHDRVDHAWMVRTVQDYQRELLQAYDVVLVTDVDEIVAPDPALGSLGDYIDRFGEDFVNCLGYEVVHQRRVEPPLRPDRPILEQRGYWFPNDAYDKPALAQVPMEWEPGFHARADGRAKWDPDLRLIHLHRIDYELCRARHALRAQLKWDEHDVSAGWAVHNRITEDEAFERWFHYDSCFEDRGIRIELQPIPAAWRAVL